MYSKETESEVRNTMSSEKIIKPIITVENSGNPTRVKILGVDISTALTEVNYSATGCNDSRIGLEISISRLIEILTEITPEDIRNAQEILASYKESRVHLKENIS
jgi:hypothetical protein